MKEVKEETNERQLSEGNEETTWRKKEREGKKEGAVLAR